VALAGFGGNCGAFPRQQASDADSSAKQESRETSTSDKGSTKEASDVTADADYDNTLGPHLLKNFAEDQEAIWTSPRHLRLIDADWLLPLGVATGVMLATDTEFSKHHPSSPSRIKYSTDLSNYGVGAMAGIGGGLYLWGRLRHDDHKRETGFLAGEAAIDSLAVSYALKYSLGRERPLQDDSQGAFWQGGVSFPSEHSSAAWSIAGIFAHEYPGPVTTVLSYGLAAAISSARVTAKQHFPSDVLVGSTIGWFVAREVYRHHHDPTLDGSDWETYAESRDEGPGLSSTPAGSPYVELDNWVYPALERLAALGYIHSEFLDMRPWTRLECANLVEEVGDQIRERNTNPDWVEEMYSALEDEFAPDLEANGATKPRARLESLYAGVTGIEGTPLNDSYHFGQTIINNYGRPYEEGFSTYDGFSGYGTAGRFTLYVRGEYQHAPSAPAYPLSVREAISVTDQNPVQPAVAVAEVNSFTLLDTYAAADVDGWDFAFGKQSLWWGPGDGGALNFSNNAAPIYMFRASRIAPFRVPLLSRLLGPMKTDFFFGKLSGNQFPPRPLIHGEKITFKPTENVTVSFSRTSEFGGVGRPMTPAAIGNSYVSFSSSGSYGPADNPGKRTGGFDFSWKVPFVRNWLTLYTDAYSSDDPSPVDAPRRAAIVPGIYLARFPRVPKLDLRVEGGYTDITTSRSNNGDFVYWEGFYHDAQTNKGNIIGSWIGREGKGIQAWTTYWFNSRNNIQLGYREAKVAKDFIPNGETINDASFKVNWWIHNDINVSGGVQYEKWLVPILAPNAHTNWTSEVQIGFWPRSWSR